MGRGWGQTDGRIGRMGKAITSRAGKVRDFSIRSVRTATSAAAVGDALGRFREMLPRRKPLDAGLATGDDDSGPTRHLVPVPPRVIPEAPPEPVPQTPEAAREPVSEPPEAVKQPVSEPPEAQPEPLPETPSPLPEPAPEPVTASNPERPASPPVEGEGPVETPRPSASAALPKEARRAEALAKLPWPFRSRINALRRTTRKDVLRPLIVDIIEERGWTTSADLALLLGVGSPQPGPASPDPAGRGRCPRAPPPGARQASKTGVPGERRADARLLTTPSEHGADRFCGADRRRVRLFCGQKVMLDRDSAALYGVEVAGSGAGRQAQPGPVPT